MRKKIAEATDQELKIAAIMKGLTFQTNAGRDKIIAKLQAVIEGDEIDVGGDPVPQEPVVAAAPVVAAPAAVQAPTFQEKADPAAVTAQRSVGQIVGGQGDDIKWVIIATSEAEDGHEPIWLGCNGKGIWAPRGGWIPLRAGYVESLRNAKEARYEKMKDPETGKEIMNPTPKWSLRYPFQTWTLPGQPPIEEWHPAARNIKETSGNASEARPAA